MVTEYGDNQGQPKGVHGWSRLAQPNIGAVEAPPTPSGQSGVTDTRRTHRSAAWQPDSSKVPQIHQTDGLTGRSSSTFGWESREDRWCLVFVLAGEGLPSYKAAEFLFNSLAFHPSTIPPSVLGNRRRATAAGDEAGARRARKGDRPFTGSGVIQAKARGATRRCHFLPSSP